MADELAVELVKVANVVKVVWKIVVVVVLVGETALDEYWVLAGAGYVCDPINPSCSW